MNEKVSIPLLNNTNYSTWKVRMQMLLTRDDYWFTVEDPKPEPVTPTWKRGNQKALATIILFIEDSQMNLVKSVTTAKEAWYKLKAYHEKATMTSRVSLLKRICSLNLAAGRNEGPEMERHLFELEELFDRLECAGQGLESSLKIAMVLRSLPDSCDGLVTALESRKDEDLTMEIVKQKLLDEWQRRSERSVSSRFGTGERSLKSVVKEHEKKICYYCRKPGHFRRNCRLLKKQQNDDGVHATEAKQATEKNKLVCFAVRNRRHKYLKVEFGASRCSIVNPTANGELRETLFEVKIAGAKLSKNKARCEESCKLVRNATVNCSVNLMLPSSEAEYNQSSQRRSEHSSQEEQEEPMKIKGKEEAERDEEFLECSDENFDYWMQTVGCDRCSLQNNQAGQVPW